MFIPCMFCAASYQRKHAEYLLQDLPNILEFMNKNKTST